MKVLKHNLFLGLLTISLFSSCSNNDKKVNFFNGQLKKIDFTEEYFLNGDRIDVDTIGIGYVKVFDPYIILGTYSSPYFTQIYMGITVRFVPLISVYLCHPFRFK